MENEATASDDVFCYFLHYIFCINGIADSTHTRYLTTNQPIEYASDVDEIQDFLIKDHGQENSTCMLIDWKRMSGLSRQESLSPHKDLKLNLND